MKKVLYLMLAVLIMLSSVNFSQAADTKIKVKESITISASPQMVWDKIKDFNGVHTWHPAFADSKLNGEQKVGVMRTIFLKNGDTTVPIEEKLLAYDDAKMSFSYNVEKVDTKIVPIKDYTSTMTVKPADSGSASIDWEGNFNAAEGAKDEDAFNLIKGAYTAGLENLKKILEKK
jgi:hypothetical protein